MKTYLCLFACALFATATHAQQNKSQPKESWNVNKERDEQGNITRYDSTYTWSYSNMDGESVNINMDSIMNSFHSYFDQQFPSIWKYDFGAPVWNDSLLHRDFFNQDYFFNRWQNDFFQMDNMFRQMDSLRNRFFYESFPGLSIPPQPDTKEKNEGTKL